MSNNVKKRENGPVLHGDGATAHQEEEPATIVSRRSIQVGLVAFTALYTPLFSGAIFGWGPMQLLLEKDGAFESQCQGDELPCDGQSVKLVQVQLLATVMAVFSPLVGVFTDRYGALALMYLLAAVGSLGISISVVASATEIDPLHFIGFALCGLMFVCTNIMIVQTGLVLPGKAQRRAISTLNALLDAGTVTYLALYEIGEATDADFVQIMGGYLCLALFCFGGAIFFWRALVRMIEATVEEQAEEKKDFAEPAEKEQVNRLSKEQSPTKEDTEPTEMSRGEECITCMNQRNGSVGEGRIDGSTNVEDSSNVDSKDQEKTLKQQSTQPDSCHTNKESNFGGDDYQLIAERDPWDQLKSQQFVLMLVFFSVHLARNNYTMATARDFLAGLGDDEEGNKYISLFTGLSAMSLVGVPFIDLLIGKYGFPAALQAVNVLGIIHGIIQVASKNLDVHVVGFVVFSFYRCFTFSTSFSFLPTFLSGATIGRGCGIMSFVSALFSLVNIGLAHWAIHELDGDFFVPNLLFLLLIVPTMYVTWIIKKCVKREGDAAKLLDKSSASRHSRHSLSIVLSQSCTFLIEPDDIGGGTYFREASLRKLEIDC